MNYQRYDVSDAVKYHYEVVGEYQSVRSANDRLTMVNVSQIFWPGNGFSQRRVESRCSPECPFGQVRQLNQDRSKRCCWVCVPCNEHAKIVDNYTCSDCALGEYPDESRSGKIASPCFFSFRRLFKSNLFARIQSVSLCRLNTFDGATQERCLLPASALLV